jgi:hypothetical protein
LERLPSAFAGFLSCLPVAGDDARQIGPPASGIGAEPGGRPW